MPAAALTPKTTSQTAPKPAARTKRRTPKPVLIDLPYAPLEKHPLPPGRPREWYITHNRRLKAMRLAIALLDSGVWVPNQASNVRIRSMAEDIGVHPPSDITCHMVRALMRYSR